MRNKPSPLLVAGIVILVSGCSAVGIGESEPGLGPISTPGLDPAAITTPLDGYMPTPEENYALKRARVTLVNQCMRDLGYPDNPQPLGRFTGERLLAHSGFQLLPVSHVEQFGYAPLPSPSSGETSEKEYGAAVSEQQGALLTGKVSDFHGKKVPAGGCEGEAVRVITKGARTDQKMSMPDGTKVEAGADGFAEGYAEMVISAARGEIMSNVHNDSRYKDAVSSWSVCMDKQGFDYKAPLDAWEDKRWQDGGTPSKAEISTATADMRCKEKINFAGVGTAVQSAYEAKYIEENAEALADLKSKTAQWIKNANDAVRAD
ncbi:hypothetical protein ACFWNG_30230 [Streptomyces sp. NPDC058391]|uniref:hypothetical protein n=1 Tax=unclassified Streptomyces TaxID=2593676 RepID=UPI003661F773